MSNISKFDVVNAATLEKVVLSQKIAAFLSSDQDGAQRLAIENVARMLAQDVSVQVREALAFELRVCKQLPYDLAAKIASDVERVSNPFLAHTVAFSDEQLSGLIPFLEDHAHITLSRRSDLGPSAIEAIVTVGSKKSVSFIIRNPQVSLSEQACGTVVERFHDSSDLMEKMSERVDLPIPVVEQLVLLVSDEYQDVLINSYNVDKPVAEAIALSVKAAVIWEQVRKASPAQIHAYVIDLKKRDSFNHDVAVEIVNRGCLPLLESILALDAGLTLGAVRHALYSGDMTQFVTVMKEAGVGRQQAEEYRKIIRLHGTKAPWPPGDEEDRSVH